MYVWFDRLLVYGIKLCKASAVVAGGRMLYLWHQIRRAVLIRCEALVEDHHHHYQHYLATLTTAQSHLT